jgi:hypothetical protein
MTSPAGPYSLPASTRRRLLDCAKLSGRTEGNIAAVSALAGKLADAGYWAKCPRCGTASLAIALAAASTVRVWCACGWAAEIRYGASDPLTSPPPPP